MSGSTTAAPTEYRLGAEHPRSAERCHPVPAVGDGPQASRQIDPFEALFPEYGRSGDGSERGRFIAVNVDVEDLNVDDLAIGRHQEDGLYASSVTQRQAEHQRCPFAADAPPSEALEGERASSEQSDDPCRATSGGDRQELEPQCRYGEEGGKDRHDTNGSDGKNEQ